MAGRKKKPASNPARGFATTSIASKPKAIKTEEIVEEQKDSKDISGVKSTATKNDQKVQNSAKELHELTPEELEAQLEQDELQLIVDGLGQKVRKDSLRQIGRVQTDRRNLRSQAQDLSLKDWFSDRFVAEVVELASVEERAEHTTSEHRKSLGTASQQDTIGRLWTLKDSLDGLDLPSDRTQALLERFVSHPPLVDPTGQVWGFRDALDLLSLECDEKELPSFTAHPVKSTSASSTGKLTLSSIREAQSGCLGFAPLLYPFVASFDFCAVSCLHFFTFPLDLTL
jgi:ATP-dependent RNA helicase DHX29